MRLRHAFPLLALTLCTLALTACSPTLRSVGRGFEAGAIEAKREITSMQKAGEIEPATAEKYGAVLDEVEANGHDLTLVVNWNAMTPAEKRRTIRQQIESFERSAVRLDEAGVLGIKSTGARKKVESFQRKFQRGLSALRIIEATLPPSGETTAKK